MSTMLVKNTAVLVTMDDARREIAQGGLFIRDNVIEQVAPTETMPETADTVLDLRDHIVLPGLINTHHHLYQTLTRVIAQDADLFTWLKTLYPIWANLTDEAVYVSTLTGLAELALSGSTTSSDHLYIFPNDCTLTARSAPRRRSACVSTPRAAPCRWARARAACPPTASPKMKPSFSKTAGG
jgi:8-oxoguanine deaminase